MNFSLRHIVSVCTIFLFTQPLFAYDFSRMVFLAHDAINVASELSPPPAKHSPEERADFDEIFRLQASRTLEECQRATRALYVSLETLFGGEELLSPQELKHWRVFFDKKVFVDTGYFMMQAKELWQRPRPYLTNERVKPCIRRDETSPAYPSGHATIAWAYGRVLSHIFPSRAVAITTRALEVGHDRVLSGVHHPSDIAAGQKLGEIVFQKLMTTEKFKNELSRLLEQSKASR